MTAFGAEPLPEELGNGEEEASDRKVVALRFPSWVPAGLPWQELRGAVEGVFASAEGIVGGAIHELVSGLPFWPTRNETIEAELFDNDEAVNHDPVNYDICGSD